jgi:glycosyltransferase involved in cell wall biosynthesis
VTRLWIDVDDLFRYGATDHQRPSGIQRVAFELALALHDIHGESVRFIRHGPGGRMLVPVPWESVAALYAGLTMAVPTVAPASGIRRHLSGLSPALRAPLGRIVRGLREIAQGAGEFAAALPRLMKPRPRPPLGPSFASQVRPGDTLLILGSPWLRIDYPARAAALRERHGLRTVLLVHDLVPIRRPEWCQPVIVEAFKPWMVGMLPLCDQVLAVSHFTAGDVESYAASLGLTLRAPVRAIPMGSGFAPVASAAPTRPLPAPGTYVLVVATLEVRKNHALLVRVWRRLLEQMPPGTVPLLVFAGGIGWLVDDLLRQLRTARWLDGHIQLIRDPGDNELAALYRGCLFTVFPSLWEGWGLPVTESLAFGKPCLAAEATSLPEAAGGFAGLFDPEDTGAATRAIRAVLDDRDALAAWEAQIRRDFRPVPWSAGAQAIAAALDLESAA